MSQVPGTVFLHGFFIVLIICFTNDLQLPTTTSMLTYNDDDQRKQEGQGWEGEEALVCFFITFFVLLY